MANVKFNPGWEKALEEQVRSSPEFQRIQEGVNQNAQQILRDVNAEMSGGDVEEILAVLTTRVSALGNVKPNAAELRKYAEAISNGTLK